MRHAHASPVTFTVSTTLDEPLTSPSDTNCVSLNGCSLRAALKAADNRGADTTTVNVPGATYNLALGALQVGGTAGERVIIAGSSAVIAQAPLCSEPVLNCMVLFLDPNGIGGVTVNISGLTIEGGSTGNAGGGGGILAGSLSATGDTLTISSSTISGNTSGGGAPGGGIAFAHGSLTLDNVTISGNRAVGGGSGGGLDFSDVVVGDGGSTLTVTNSTFSGNSTDATLTGGGGGLHLLGALSSYSISNSTFSGNTSLAAGPAGGGGAILKDSGSLTITGSTFTDNSAGAGGSGGAIFTSSDASNLGDAITPGLNRFAANHAAGGSGQSLFRDSLNTGVVTAEDNWWGTNTPNAGDAAKNVSLTAWFVLKLSASPPFVLPGGSTSLTGDLSHTNLNTTPGLLPNVTSIAVSWPGPTLGTISGAAAFLNGSQQADATYTADGASGTGTASVQVDGQTVTVNIPILAAMSISKAFGAGTVPLNGATGLTFTLTNPNPTTPVTGIGFTDSLPSGLLVATPNGLDGTCVGTRTATAGSSSISTSGITLAGGASCTVTVNVTGSAVGVKNNVTGPVISNEAGTGGTASASIDVLAPPAIAKAFNPVTIALGATSQLTFTISNPNLANSLTRVAFQDTLPAGMTVPSGTSSPCGGTLNTFAPAGIALDGASVPANGTCTFAVTVTGTASGTHVNTTGEVFSNNGGMGNTARASLTVASPPTIVKSFGAASIPIGGTTSLSFTISNPNASLALTGVGFTDTLPAGLAVATPNGVAGSCGGGTSSALAGSFTVSLAGGTLPSGAVCTISVNVTGTTAGVKNNAVQVTSNEGGTGNTSNGVLTVVAPPTISKAFGSASVPLRGSTPLTFAINNPNATNTLTDVGFTDTLPAGLVVSSPNSLAGGCTGGVITANPGGSVISLSGATLAPGSGCSFAVSVTATAAGSITNVSGNVTSNEGGSGGTATASLAIVAAPTLSKVFAVPGIPLNGSTSLTFTITNPSANTVPLNGVGLTDTLPAGLVVSTPSGQTGACDGGTIVAAPGSGVISLTGATLGVGGSCSFSVNVTGVTDGNKMNTTGPVNSSNGGNGNTASAALEVASAPTIVKSFGATSIPGNGSTSLTFTINNLNSTVTLSGVGFTDSLPAGLVVASPSGLSGSCGGGTITAVAGSSTVSLANATLAPSSSCSFSVNVTGTTPGQKNNAVQVTSTEGGPGNVSNASITVVAPPLISKAFGAGSIPLNGSTALSFTISNPNATTTLTGIGFTDTLPVGLVVSTPNELAGSCGAGVITAVAASNSISLSGAALAAGASCTVSVNVTGTTAGTKNNTTGLIASREGGTGGTASASILVVAPPSITKAFGRAHISRHHSTTLTFTITNPDLSVALTGVGFIDNLPAGLVVATPNGLVGSCGGGTIVSTAGTGTINLAGATLAPKTSCTFSVRITAIKRGTYTNVTDPVTSTNGGVGNAASAHLRVTGRGDDDNNDEGDDSGGDRDTPDGGF